MKTRKFSLATAIILIFLTTAFFFSCTKEELISPAADNDSGIYDENTDGSFKQGASSYIFQPQAHMYGHSYAEWGAIGWKIALELPVLNHPFLAVPPIYPAEDRSVLFLAGLIDVVPRVVNVTIPHGKALFVTVFSLEVSNLEDAPFFGATEAEQRANADALADLITDVFLSVDGVPINNLDAYRFSSPQFAFNAPNPWIFSAPGAPGEFGGPGTGVGDGYTVMVKPLPKGPHTIRFGGAIPDFGVSIDMTYNLTIE